MLIVYLKLSVCVDFQMSHNQKFGLCEALLKVGDWRHAKAIMDAMVPFSAMSYQPVAQALCSLVSYVIEPLYSE